MNSFTLAKSLKLSAFPQSHVQIDVLISGCGIVIRVDKLAFSTYLTVLKHGRQSGHISFCTTLPSTHHLPSLPFLLHHHSPSLPFLLHLHSPSVPPFAFQLKEWTNGSKQGEQMKIPFWISIFIQFIIPGKIKVQIASVLCCNSNNNTWKATVPQCLHFVFAKYLDRCDIFSSS